MQKQRRLLIRLEYLHSQLNHSATAPCGAPYRWLISPSLRQDQTPIGYSISKVMLAATDFGQSRAVPCFKGLMTLTSTVLGPAGATGRRQGVSGLEAHDLVVDLALVLVDVKREDNLSLKQGVHVVLQVGLLA